MGARLLASVRKDIINAGLKIAVYVPSADVPTEFEFVSFTRRPALPLAYGDQYQVLLKDGRYVIAESIDLEFEEN